VRLGLNNNIRGASAEAHSFGGRLPGQVNAIFTIRGYNGQWYKLAHVSILQVIGRPTPGGPEGMVCVQKRDNGNGDYVVWVRSLEGAAH